jgi:hypothetical protein
VIDPAKVCLFIPPELKEFKLRLFNRIGDSIRAQGGRVVRGSPAELAQLPAEIAPIVGCTPELRPLIDGWVKTGRRWI